MSIRSAVATIGTTTIVALVAVAAAAAGSLGPSDVIAGDARITAGPVAGQQVPASDLGLRTSSSHPTAVYSPIIPCRIVNTLLASGGRFGGNTTHSYVVAGTAGFPAQGGTSGGCGIPPAAIAITASLTANNPIGHGYMRAWPSGGTEPTGGVLTYPTNTAVSGGATLAIKPGGGTALTVRNHTGSTDLVIDVTGYYAPPIQGTFNYAGLLYWGSGRLTLDSHTADSGRYVLIADQDLTACSATVSAYSPGHNATGGADGGAYVTVWVTDLSGVAVDSAFSVVVDC